MFPQINWHLISLETLITLTIFILVVIDMVMPKESRKGLIGVLSFTALFGILGFWMTQAELSGATFGGIFVMDPLAWFFKSLFLITMAFIFPMTEQFFKPLSRQHNEFYFLLWIALLGMCLIASCADFLLLFISIEILTIALYVLAAYLKSDKLAIEAGMKYLVLGALSSGFFLYGMSFLYGITHSTRFDVIESFVHAHTMTPMMAFGIILVFSAVGFKIAAVPFQMWVPDVYQGAPTPVTAVLSVGSKAAGFVMLIRLFSGVFADWHVEFGPILAALSALTMTYGNCVALFQTNMKRLLGYSSIAHAGYLLMGAVAGSALGISAMNFYLLGYLFTNLAAFLVIILFGVAAQSDEIKDYAGLSKRSGILSLALVISFVSLAGFPPVVGFFGKFILLVATVQSGLIWLALIAIVNIVISLYYYLLVVKRIYVDAPSNSSSIQVSWRMRVLLIFAMTGIIGIGIFQAPFLDAAMTAAKGMFTAP